MIRREIRLDFEEYGCPACGIILTEIDEGWADFKCCMCEKLYSLQYVNGFHDGIKKQRHFQEG